MTNLTAAAMRRTFAARRHLAAGSAALLMLLWLSGICGLPLPTGVDPRVNPSGHAAAQLLLFLLILPAAANLLVRGEKAVAAFKPDAVALLLLSAVAALADGVLNLFRIAIAAGQGAFAAASSLASELPLAILGAALVCAVFCEQLYELPKTGIIAKASRILFVCETLVAVAVCGAALSRGAGFAEASHVALLFLSLGAPASLLCAAPLFGFAAEKCASLSLSCTELERLGTVTAVYPEEDVLLQETPSLDDLYTVTGNKPALLATAAALACGTADPHAEALADAAASLGLRLPRSTAVRCTADGFCGAVHRRTWRFSADSRSVPELIRRTDFGDRQMLYAFSDGNFRGVLLFARQTCPDADAAMRRLHDAGLVLPNFEDERRASTAFLPRRREKVLHAARDGGTIRLTDADGAPITLAEGTPTALASAILLGQRVTAALRAAVGLTAAAILFCLPASVGAFAASRATVLAAAAAVRLAAMVSVLLLSLFVRYTQPPEIHIDEERTAMFGKVNYTIHVEGMSCSHCAAHVKTALESIRGVSASVELDEKLAHVKCPAALDEKQLADAVTEAGFTVASIERV